jgi:hypothetical protein
MLVVLWRGRKCTPFFIIKILFVSSLVLTFDGAVDECGILRGIETSSSDSNIEVIVGLTNQTPN